MRKTLIIITAVGLALAGCKKKGCTDVNANNFDAEAKKEDGSCTYDDTYDVPETYQFVDENGNSTVSFNGQKQRLEMLSELVSYAKTANTKGTVVDATTLKDMFANNGHTWTDADGMGMTGSSKQLKNKCAGGDATITATFEEYMDSLATISALNQDGSAGTAGVYPNDGSKGPYLMGANGVEYAQWIEKGLMGAVFYYQITNVYLGNEKMDVDNTNPVDESAGKYYTTMEHHWDEAFGYFTSEVDYPANGTDRFFGKYANEFEALLGSQTNITKAFLKGRAAIANDDLTERDAQRTVICDEMEKLIVAAGIHYLNQSISNITKNTTRNHALSEATAFIESLKYGYNSVQGLTISKTQINDILDTIGDDFNNVTASDLQSARDTLSSIFGMDDIKDSL